MLYRVVRFLCFLYLKIFNHWLIKGKENIHEQGSAVLVANHVSLWDPVIFACSVDRTIHFMAKEELFKAPIIGKIFPVLCAFPIKRGQGDRNALRIAGKLLNSGEVLGLFPEGTRSKTGDLLPFHPGAALFALRSRAPIIVMYIEGSKTTFPLSLRGKIKVNISKPKYFEDLYEKKVTSEDLDMVTSDIMEEMKRLQKDVHEF